jgi:hypothetical protein
MALRADTTAWRLAVRMLACMPTPPTRGAVLVSGLDVGDGLRLGTRADGMLAVVDDVELDPQPVA